MIGGLRKPMENYASIGKDILIIDKYFKLYFKNSLKHHDLNTAEGMVLLMLYDKKDYYGHGRTQEQMIHELHYDKSVMARTTQRLESKGFILRHPNPKDSRSSIFTLTEKAENFKPTMIQILIEWNTGFLQHIPQENLKIISESFETMMINAMELVNTSMKEK